MLTTTGTEFGGRLAVVAFAAAVVAAAATLPVRWRTGAERMWSYSVYYVGYRLLSVQVTCGSWAVSALPLVAKHA